MNEEKKRITILCSNMDKASQNIKKHLLKLKDWNLLDLKHDDWKEFVCVYETQNFWLVEINAPHIYQDGIDKKLNDLGLDTELIIVASKHKSKDGNKVLTAHFTGNSNDADFGGLPNSLSYPAPFAIKAILLNIKNLSACSDYEISLEATHHGPTDISIPMVYVEIGSTETEWEDEKAGNIIAKVIIDVNEKKVPIAIGFGGGHYAHRQTKLIIESNITFGHNFSNYQLDHIDLDLVKQAINKSQADFIYLDRKALSSVHKEKLRNIAEKLDVPILREREIIEMEKIPWHIYSFLLKTANALCSGSHIRMSTEFKKHIEYTTTIQQINICKINDEILNKVIKINQEKFMHILNNMNMAYLEKNNGTLYGIIFSVESTKKASSDLFINECIQILKERYAIKYIPEERILYITEEKFDPKLAIEFGVTPGPMFEYLKSGRSVKIDNNFVEPSMVYRKNTKKIII